MRLIQRYQPRRRVLAGINDFQYGLSIEWPIELENRVRACSIQSLAQGLHRDAIPPEIAHFLMLVVVFVAHVVSSELREELDPRREGWNPQASSRMGRSGCTPFTTGNIQARSLGTCEGAPFGTDLFHRFRMTQTRTHQRPHAPTNESSPRLASSNNGGSLAWEADFGTPSRHSFAQPDRMTGPCAKTWL